MSTIGKVRHKEVRRRRPGHPSSQAVQSIQFLNKSPPCSLTDASVGVVQANWRRTLFAPFLLMYYYEVT
uniref:Uncharacterized protein n=1 Tax=Aegilops tauschii subsp. strangulata TaxID=200361 RepID=A0A453A9H7_AEGTS